MRHPVKERGRQVSFQIEQASAGKVSPIDSMKARIDSEEGRYRYSRRLGTVEPVFGNIRTTKRLDRFSLRGKRKVNAQWLMYCLVHNVEKLQHYGQMA